MRELKNVKGWRMNHWAVFLLFRIVLGASGFTFLFVVMRMNLVETNPIYAPLGMFAIFAILALLIPIPCDIEREWTENIVEGFEK